MKKQLFTLCLTFATAFTFAQQGSPRLSLYEEFTGETCPPCASTNPALNAMLHSQINTPKVVAIKWQVPIPSAPSATWSLYKSNQTEIAQRQAYYPSQYTSSSAITQGVNSAPQGRLDGQHQWTFGAANDHAGNLTNAAITSAQSNTAAFSVVLARQLDPTNTAFNVTVNIVATAPFTANGALVFRTVMIDKLVQFSVQPGSNGEKKFEDVAVKSFPTLQNGTALKNSWSVGDIKTFTLNCPIPAYILSGQRDRSIDELDFVGMIQDNGNKKVAQAVRGSDCSYISIDAATEICEGESVTLNAAGAINYLWSTGDTGPSIVVTPTDGQTFHVSSPDVDACPNLGDITFKVVECTGIKNIAKNALQVEVYPNPSKGEFLIKGAFSNEKTHMVIYNNLGQKVYEQDLNANESSVKTNLAKGLYTYEISQSAQKSSTGKLVIE